MRTQSYNNAIHQGWLCEFASEFDALKSYAAVSNIALRNAWMKYCMQNLKFLFRIGLCFFNSLNNEKHSKLFEAISQINLK